MLTLYGMSFYGAILITVIILIRSLAVNRLPKKAFLFLWTAALARLLLPFRFSSPTSIWHTVGRLLPQTMTASNNILQTVQLSPAAPPAVQPEAALLPGFTGDAAGTLCSMFSPAMLLWLTGFSLLALYLIITHLKSRQIYCCSLPLEQPYIQKWTQECRLRRRPVQVRCSDRIESPLTYGILWPVILLPKNTDWADEHKLGFILTHEMAHVRRFDALTKWLLAAALCIHWFNPFVWAMYVLAGRDLELSCDESVLRRYGPDAKAPYALALVSLEERRSRPAPLISSFSKNALKERITAIMTARTITPAAALSAVLITAITVGVFATSAPAMPGAAAGQNSEEAVKTPSSSEKENTILTDAQEEAGYTLPSYDFAALSYTREEYDRLLAALQTDHWETMSIAAFNRHVYAALYGTQAQENDLYFLYEQIASEIPDTDPNASYLKNTVRYSLTEYSIRQQEAYSGKRLDPECNAYFENPAFYTQERPVSFSMASYRFSYRILDQDALTVAGRDAFLQQILGQADALLRENALRDFTRQDFETSLKKIGAAASGSEITFTGCSIDTFE